MTHRNNLMPRDVQCNAVFDKPQANDGLQRLVCVPPPLLSHSLGGSRNFLSLQQRMCGKYVWNGKFIQSWSCTLMLCSQIDIMPSYVDIVSFLFKSYWFVYTEFLSAMYKTPPIILYMHKNPIFKADHLL